MKDFYVVEFSESDDVPIFFDEIWTPELPLFNQVVINPDRSIFALSYELLADLDYLNVDVIFEQYIASAEFLQLCEDNNCSFLAVPLDVRLRNKKQPQKKYSFFVVLDRCSLLDPEKSTFECLDERLLMPMEEREDLSPVYDRIDSFVPRSGVEYNLFFCEEMKKMVCSGEFMAGYLARKLTGLEFKKIDDSFIYAPWG